MAESSILPKWGRRPFATGVSRYADHDGKTATSGPRIFLEVRLGWLEGTVVAMVDTAAPWCIFEPGIGQLIGESFDRVSTDVSLSTRLGTFRGSLYRGPLFVPALEGEPLDVEMTVFVSPDWQGPNFVGYQGLLQRIRFAVDPETNLFYFGQI
ncbi:MAG TPA: hypothetical protein VGH73_06320 [Thermoanaerobaculia bacterium]